MYDRERASDRAIAQKVSQNLINRGLRPPCDIRVMSRNGIVTLSGIIQYEYQRKNAIRTALAVPGVRRVTDQLTVKHRESWADRTSAQRRMAN
ncbi:MAG: BON domain-containing protein [Thermoguttaceae bacterium]